MTIPISESVGSQNSWRYSSQQLLYENLVSEYGLGCFWSRHRIPLLGNLVALNTSGELEGDKSTGTARLSLELAEHTITASIDTVLDEKEAPIKLAGIIASHGAGHNSPRLDVGEYGGFVDGFTAIFSKASDCQLLLIDGGNNQLVHNVEYEIPRELINIIASIAPKK